MRKSLILSLVVPLLVVVVTGVALGQKERRVIQLSGVVLGLDEALGLAFAKPGADRT